MKRMKSLKGSALTVLFGMAVLCTVMFAACPNAAKGGGKSGPAYVKVPYDKLDGYLANTASADKVNYIEITGEVPKEWFTGKVVSGNTEAGELGKKILAAAPKKVALKLPGKVEGLDSMFACFYRCTNLVSLAGIPANVTDMSWCFEGCTGLTKAPVIRATVTDMTGCFYGCTSLTEAPYIPKSVKDMAGCFSGCTSLTKAPDIPEGVTNMENCFSSCTSLTKAPDIPEGVTNMENCFDGCTALKGVKLLCNYNGTGEFVEVFLNCTALEAGGIKVPAAFYNNYTADEALDVMKVPPAGNPAEQKKKFSSF